MVFAERCIISPVIAQEHREYRHWSTLRRIVEATLVESRVSAPVRRVVVCGVVGVRPLRSGRRGRQGEQEGEKGDAGASGASRRVPILVSYKTAYAGPRIVAMAGPHRRHVVNELSERHEQWIAAVNSRDIESYAELVAEDVVWIPPAGHAIDGIWRIDRYVDQGPLRRD